MLLTVYNPFLFPSSGTGPYADSGIVGSEKAAVIAGCVGGLLLVVVLVATYCYCLPSTLKRRLNRRHQSPEDSEKAATSLVNGGSVVVKSASRGSVLVNAEADTPSQDATDLTGTPPVEGRGGAINMPSLQPQPPPCEVMQVSVSPPTRRNGGDSTDEATSRRGLSMSIPDVTKVEHSTGSNGVSGVGSGISSREADERPSLPSVPAPQFYTLGRHTRTANRTPLRGPNGHIYGSSDLSYQ